MPFGSVAVALPDWSSRYEAIPSGERDALEAAIAPVYPTAAAYRHAPGWREVWTVLVVSAWRDPEGTRLKIARGPLCAPVAPQATADRIFAAFQAAESEAELRVIGGDAAEVIAALPGAAQERLRDAFRAKLGRFRPAA